MARKKDVLFCPDTIRVFGRTYTINHERAGGLGQDRMGSCDNINQIITADIAQSPIEEADTIFHESLHAIAWTMKMDLGEDEERIVSTFATGILGLLQDNPKFGAWLVDNKSAHLEDID